MSKTFLTNKLKCYYPMKLLKTPKPMKLSFRIHKDLDLIFDCLTDMQKFVSVHPVISKIDKTSDQSYLVHETLKFGFIPFSFTYPVTIDKCIINKIAFIRATVIKLTRIEMKFVLKDDNDYTNIFEEITFNSPFPVTFILKKVFKEQHEKLFKNIEANYSYG